MKKLLFLILLFAVPAQAEILWYGDYESGFFHKVGGSGWHLSDTARPSYWGIPQYGRPPQMTGDSNATNYYGNGTLLTLVTDDPALERVGEVVAGEVRQGNYAVRVTVKSEAGGGSEVDNKDCDVTGCANRRTELWMNQVIPTLYDALPYMSERWLSISHFVPSDWDTVNGTGWGPTVFQIKPKNDGAGPVLEIGINGDSWQIIHRFSEVENPVWADVPWQQHTYYNSTRPLDNDDERDFRADFPVLAASQTALGDLNKGGWTDWIINVKFDAIVADGTGFLKIWKRSGSDAWVQVLEILPKVVNVRGVDYNRGIMYNSPASGTDNGGFGPIAGMYMQKTQVWGLAADRVIFNDNTKIGSATTVFDEMRPEGADPPVPLSRVPGVRLSGGIGWR